MKMKIQVCLMLHYSTNDSSHSLQPTDIIQGIDPEKQHLLDVPQRRDPDALPPGNILEVIGSLFHRSAAGLTRGNAVFGFKAGVVSS